MSGGPQRSRRAVKPVFGRPLKEGIPDLFRDCIQFLASRALHVDGLFTKEGNLEKIQLMRRAWDQGHDPLKLARVEDPHAIAGALKLWLMCLPDPAVPPYLLTCLLRLNRIEGTERRMAAAQFLVRQAQMQWLRPLLELLHHYRLNRPNHLLVPLFAMLLLRPVHNPSGPPDKHATSGCDEATLLVDVLITNYKALFSQLPIISVVEIPKSPRSPPAGPPPLACTVLTGPPSGLGTATAATVPLPNPGAGAISLPPPQAGAAWAVRSPHQALAGGTEAARMQTALAGRGLDLIEDLEGHDAELRASVAGLLQGSLDDALFEADDRQACLHRSVSFLSARTTVSLASASSGGLASDDGGEADGPGPAAPGLASPPHPSHASAWPPGSPASSGPGTSPPTSPVSPLLGDPAWRDHRDSGGGAALQGSAWRWEAGALEGSKAKLSTSQLLRTLHVSEFSGGSPKRLAAELAQRGSVMRMSRALPPPGSVHTSAAPVTWAAYLVAGEGPEDERAPSIATPAAASPGASAHCHLMAGMQAPTKHQLRSVGEGVLPSALVHPCISPGDGREEGRKLLSRWRIKRFTRRRIG